jgi:sec-independent protein translocase protein TatA
MFGLQNIGWPEIVIVALVLLILFGPKKLPEFAKGISDAIKEVANAFKGDKDKEKEKEKEQEKKEV